MNISHSPRMIEAWRRGTISPVKIRVKSHGAAINLRQRLYRLRRALASDGNEIGRLAYGANIRLQHDDTDNNWFVIIEPTGTDLEAALIEAGIDLPSPPELTSVSER